VLTNSDRSSYPYYGPSRHDGRSRRWMVAKAANSKGKRADLADKSPPPG
jgi:hypothetical protein